MAEKSEKPEKKDEEIETSDFGNPNSGSCVKMILQKSSEYVFAANILNREKTGKASKDMLLLVSFYTIFRENKFKMIFGIFFFQVFSLTSRCTFSK